MWFSIAGKVIKRHSMFIEPSSFKRGRGEGLQSLRAGMSFKLGRKGGLVDEEDDIDYEYDKFKSLKEKKNMLMGKSTRNLVRSTFQKYKFDDTGFWLPRGCGLWHEKNSLHFCIREPYALLLLKSLTVQTRLLRWFLQRQALDTVTSLTTQSATTDNLDYKADAKARGAHVGAFKKPVVLDVHATSGSGVPESESLPKVWGLLHAKVIFQFTYVDLGVETS